MWPGLFYALFIIRPKYLKSATFSIIFSPHIKFTSILIYMALVFFTLIYKPFYSQNILKALNKCCRPIALWETRTASSAKASKNIYNIAISNIYRFVGVMLFSSKYFNKSG
jgi:hypothetical protein